MKKRAKSPDPQRVFCEVCLTPVPKSDALGDEGRDGTVHFCSAGCYARWRGERAPLRPAPDAQEGAGRSKSREDRLKRAIRQHPQRDEPRADSVEPDETR
jgi:hypothetical protein